MSESNAHIVPLTLVVCKGKYPLTVLKETFYLQKRVRGSCLPAAQVAAHRARLVVMAPCVHPLTAAVAHRIFVLSFRGREHPF